MERQATVQVNFKLGDLKQQINSTVTGLGRGAGESTGIASDRRMKEQAEATKGLAKSMEGLATAAMATGFAMTGFVSAASPNAIDTLWTSVKLLSGEIGMSMIPAVISVSGWLQKSADWVRNLDESTKGLVGNIAIGVGTFAALGFAIHKVWSIGKLAWASLIELKDVAVSAAGAVGRFALANPALAGMIVTVGVLTSAFGLLGETIGQAADRFARLRGLQESGALNSGQRLSRRDYEAAIPERIRNRIEAAAPGERSGVINEEIQRAQQQSAQNRTSEAANAELRERFRQLDEESSDPINRGPRRVEAAREVLTTHFGAEEAERRIKRFAGSLVFGSGPEDPSIQGFRPGGVHYAWNAQSRDFAAARISGVEGQTSSSALVAGLQSVLRHGLPGDAANKPAMLANNFQSRQFGSAGSYYDTIVQRALSGGEAEKRMEELQERGNELLEIQNVIGAQIRDRMGPPV